LKRNNEKKLPGKGEGSVRAWGGLNGNKERQKASQEENWPNKIPSVTITRGSRVEKKVAKNPGDLRREAPRDDQTMALSQVRKLKKGVSRVGRK